jgi:magnesium chelatase family protein
LSLRVDRLTELSHQKKELCNRQALDRVWLPPKGQTLIPSETSQMQLSAREYHGILKLAWTIADLADREQIRPVHLTEALQYRPELVLG